MRYGGTPPTEPGTPTEARAQQGPDDLGRFIQVGEIPSEVVDASPNLGEIDRCVDHRSQGEQRLQQMLIGR